MGQLGRMATVASCALALLVVAAADSGQAEILVAPPWGTTLSEAAAEASAHAAGCARPGAGCSARAPTLREIATGPSCSDHVPVIAWRRASDLSDSNAWTSKLSLLADSREPFDCSWSTCSMVLRTNAMHERESGVSTLSICRVQLVRGVSGAPEWCQEASKMRGSAAHLVRAQVGNSFISCSMGLRDFDAVFQGRGSDLDSVRRVVMEVLAAKPFNLAVMEDRGAVVGTRTQLASDVLRGWREWVTVRVDVDARDRDAGASIFTTLLVGKQAAAEREAWTPPSEAQEAAYVLALRNELQRRGAMLTTGVGRR